MPETPRFGTDGWRGIIAEDFTFTAVRRVSQALALELRERAGAQEGGGEAPSLVIGYDTRFGSARFAAAAAEVLAAHDIHVFLCNRPVPAQVVSHAIVERGADGGIVITASHNPAQFNGIKVHAQSGAPASSAFLHAVEARLAALEAGGGEPPRRALEAAEDDGNLDRINALESYLEGLAHQFDLEALRGAGLTIVVDAMYGAGAGILPTLFAEGTTKIIEINGAANPLFPGLRGPEPIAANLTRLIRVVQDGNSALGLALDGDADRLGVVGRGGAYINGQTLFALLALYLLEGRGWNGPIVKSLNGTAMIDVLAGHFGVPVFETGVGFTAMAPVFREHDAIIAGEETGGFAFRHHLPYRDGIISGLYLLELLVSRGGDLDAALAGLEERVGAWSYERVDLPSRRDQADAMVARIRAAAPKRLAGVPIVRLNDGDGLKYYLEDGSWLLIRPSGTEPVLRLYAEARSPERVQELLARGRELTGL
jgi:phosphomannomutase